MTLGNRSIPDGLIVSDAAAFRAKFSDFAAAGGTDVHVVCDFDRTLTVKNSGSDDEVTTWHILRDHLPEAARKQYMQLFEKYRALELGGMLTMDGAVTWWSSILDLFVANTVNLAVVEDDFLSRANMRPGTKELFKYCADKGIPTVIFSAGIREVIDIWCRKYNIEPTLVISTSLRLTEDSRIVGWNRDTLVHALNKTEASHPGLHDLRRERRNVLLVGDGIDDASMAGGSGDVLKVRILDPRPDEADDQTQVSRSYEKFDAIIRSGTLLPLLALLKGIG